MEKNYELEEKISRQLAGERVYVRVYQELESTNDKISKDIDDGFSDFPAAYIALKQTHGRGRMNRNWYSFDGASLCLTVARSILHDASFAESFTVRVGCSLCGRLNFLCGGGLKLKWPNDIYSHGGKKISGILSELKILPGGRYIAVVGVGVNVDFSEIEGLKIPGEINGIYGDLRSNTAHVPDLPVLAASVIDAVVRAEFHVPDIPECFKRYDWLVGRRVSLKEGNRITEGVADGVNERGNLILSCDDGSIYFAKSGEATLIKQH